MIRILTENVNKEEVKALLMDMGLDFTMIEAERSWRGVEEKSLIIELDDCYSPHFEQISLAKAAAKKIRDMNNQQCVLIQVTDSEVIEEKGEV